MGEVELSLAAERALMRLESAVAWFYLRFLVGGESEGDEVGNYLVAANYRMYQEEYNALPVGAGANEAAVRGGFMPKKLKYFEAQLYDIVDGYRESLLKNLPDLHQRKVNGFSLTVKNALSEEIRRGLRGNLPADMLLKRLEHILKTNALLLENNIFTYRFEADGDDSTCKACTQHDGKTGTAQEFERLEITPPLHPNCRCKLNPLVDGPYLGYTENRNFYAEKLGISADALEELKQNASLEDLLFVENIAYQYGKFFHDSPSEEKILSALYVVKNYDEKTARRMLKDAGFTETMVLWVDYGEIGHILLAYEAANRGENLALLDEEYERKRQAEITALLALMAGNLVDRLLTGPAFDPATGYSLRSAWDQLEKNDYLTPEQQQKINARLNQGTGNPAGTVEGAGKLTGSLDKLTQAERAMVNDLLSQGKNVEIIPRSTLQNIQAPDFKVNGVLTELKTLNGTSLNTPVTRIIDGFKQGASTVIIDARTTNLTVEQANTVLNRVKGIYNNNIPGKIEIWTNFGTVLGGK